MLDAKAATQCRLCGSGELTQISDRLRHGPGKVYFCASCEAGSLAEIPDDEALAAFYDGEYRKSFNSKIDAASDPKSIFDSYKDYQEERLARVKPYLDKNTRLLEIGCSAGMFLHHAAPLAGEAVGIDFDSASAAHAAEVSGAKTYTRPLPETGLPKKGFDLIVMFQTLEHLPDPVKTLAEIVEWLSDDGKILLEVPNLNDPLLKLFDVPAYRSFYYHKAHLFYFTPNSLSWVAGRAGLQGEVDFSQDYNFLNHLHWVHKNAPQPDNRPGLDPAKLPLRDGLPKDARKDLDRWAEASDRAYKALLAKHGLTSNLVFLGGRKGRA